MAWLADWLAVLKKENTIQGSDLTQKPLAPTAGIKSLIMFQLFVLVK